MPTTLMPTVLIPIPMIKVLSIALTLAAMAAPARAADAVDAAPVGPEAAPLAVSLGEFSISELRAVEGAKLRIHFHLYAGVDADEAESLRKQVEEHQHRIRNEVLIAIRLCEQHEFQEPGLDRVRRRVLARLNRSLPDLPIDRLLVGEFEYFND